MPIDENVIKFPKNFAWETNGQIAELIKQAEGALPYLEENSVGYYYYWMLQELKKYAAKAPANPSEIPNSSAAADQPDETLLRNKLREWLLLTPPANEDDIDDLLRIITPHLASQKRESTDRTYYYLEAASRLEEHKHWLCAAQVRRFINAKDIPENWLENGAQAILNIAKNNVSLHCILGYSDEVSFGTAQWLARVVLEAAMSCPASQKATMRESGSLYKAAYEAYHFYVHASEAELLEKGMTRADALNEANLADIKLTIKLEIEDGAPK